MKLHLRFALRSLRRGWTYAALNVAGLSLGMLACIVIGLYVSEEVSYDRFHAQADRIAQVGFEVGEDRTLRGPYPLAETLEAHPTLVERAVRAELRRDVELDLGAEGPARAVRVLYTEASFFEVFSFPPLHGDAGAALAAPDGVVLPESVALQLFGEPNAVGRTLRLSARDFSIPGGLRETVTLTVRAVVRDAPRRSTLQFDVLAPVVSLPGVDSLQHAWHARSFFTYALLRPGASPRELEQRLSETLARVALPDGHAPFVMPLTSVYLSDLHQAEGVSGQLRFLYAFGLAALFILLIAGINYVNLATALSLRRAREIGVRKSLGASRAHIATAFLSESVVLCVLALGTALALAAALVPTFNAVVGTDLAIGRQLLTVILLALFVLAVGVGAAVYPALVLARYEPVRVLRGQSGTGGGGGSSVRRGLVLVQFIACAMLLVGAYVMGSQLRHVRTADPGFDPDRLVVFELDAQAAWRAQEAVQATVQSHPSVEGASIASRAPGWYTGAMSGPRGAFSPQNRLDPDTPLDVANLVADGHFLETLGVRLVAGRGFDPARAQDLRRSLIINESAARAMGWTVEEAVGMPFNVGTALFGLTPSLEVIGVVRDFHLTSFHEEIPALALTHAGGHTVQGTPGVVIARLAPGAGADVVQEVQAVLEPFVGEGGGLTYAFLDDRFAMLYDRERRLTQVVGAFALVAALVACLGLFGLASLTTHQRKKEIAIRRVLGASVAGVAVHLSKDFAKLVAVALLVTSAPMYLAMSRWLEGFAYRISLGPAAFLLTGLALLSLALLTVAYHTLRAASADPVRALRAES